MIPSGRIFKNETNLNYHRPISVESYMESDLTYDIYNMLNYIEENAFNVYTVYIKQKHYAALENNTSILLEGANDIRKAINDFFTKLINKLTEFQHMFITSTKTYITTFSKFLKNNEDKIKLLPDKQITFEGYNFTIDFDIPKTNIVYDIIYEYNSQVDNIDILTKQDIDKKVDSFKVDKTKDNIRSKIIGKSVNTNKCGFYDEVDKLFRDDKIEPSTLVIDKTYIVDGLNNYKEIEKLIQKTAKEFKEIDKCLKNLKTIFSRKVHINKKNNTVVFNKATINEMIPIDVNCENYDNVLLYEEYLQYQFNYTKFVTTCIVNTYMQKVKAIKDSMKQYERILKSYINEKDGTEVKVK